MKEYIGAKITLLRISEARKEILKRLLELNHKIHGEEVAKGLWEKKTSKKKSNRSQRTTRKIRSGRFVWRVK